MTEKVLENYYHKSVLKSRIANENCRDQNLSEVFEPFQTRIERKF